MKVIEMSSQSADLARVVYDALTRECYYGLNLMLVLAQTSKENCQVVLDIMNRAKTTRTR